MILFEILSGLPGDGPVPDYFGFETHGRYREGFVVRFHPADCEPWVGNFQRGMTDLCHVLDGASPALVTVIAGGQAYEIDIATRQLVREFGGAIEFCAEVPEINGVVVGNGLWFEAFHGPVLLWSTRRLSWDGVRHVSINRLVLSGEAYNPMGDCWTTFSVDLKDGTATGGSYNGPG